jgi:predicted aspartyl protease
MIRGYFDRAQRAIVRVELAGSARTEKLNMEIDTGSQPQVCIDQDWADYLGIATTEGHRATFADGTSKTVLAGAAKLNWFGELVDVEVIVWPRANSDAPKEVQSNVRRTHPDGLLGRSLLATNVLRMDYLNGEIEISESKPKGA